MVHSRGCQVVYNLYEFMKKENKSNDFIDARATYLLVELCGFSMSFAHFTAHETLKLLYTYFNRNDSLKKQNRLGLVRFLTDRII